MIEKLSIVNSELKRTGVFTGSFDPFTIGHDNIVRRALALFDRLVIGVVESNVHKEHSASAEERRKAISAVYANEPRVEVKVYGDLAVDFAHREGARYIIKGVRSVKDFEYEQEMAEINRNINGTETLLLLADPSLAYISSSMVRELRHYGKDISMYLP
jgi:pantetheine-phosphate adenylyltransferase